MSSTVVEIDGINILFPFEPYDIQRDLMAKVIHCIKNDQNGILESPTGTGKTISLLCSSLAWQDKAKNILRAQFQKPAHFSNRENPQIYEIPKVIYASRTHSQLSQSVAELKRSAYKNVKAVVLGSRDMMCIHDEVLRIPNSSGKILACQMKVRAHTCSYYNNVGTKKDEFGVKDLKVCDIEDLVLMGKRGKYCPFYMSKEIGKDADIIFLPYNYLLDPRLRASQGIDLRHSIIILDEAHNISKMCQEVVSFEIKSSNIAQCVSEITSAMKEYTEIMQNEEAPAALVKDLNLTSMIKLKKSFLELEKRLDEIERKEAGYVLPTQTFLNAFYGAGFIHNYVDSVVNDLDSISSFLSLRNSGDGSGCDMFASIFRIFASTIVAFCDTDTRFDKSYTIFVETESGKNNSKSKVFQFWCFDPAIGLQMLQRSSPKCVILASGTLSPIPLLIQELKMDFRVTLVNPHIISPQQLFAGIFSVGSDYTPLTSAFNNRNCPKYLTSFGNLISDICAIVPKGILLFFPSYSVMDAYVRFWKSTNIFGAFTSHKQVFIEPKGKEAFNDVIRDYYEAVKKGGGMLFAICRGKISEGIDFSNDNGRAVIIAGIPFLPAMDPQVVAKQKYLDAKQEKNLNGREWYILEGSRALNQAIGRIIRHSRDYGAILLCDERCSQTNFKNNLPSWVRDGMKIYQNAETGLMELKKFFLQTHRGYMAPIATGKNNQAARSNNEFNFSQYSQSSSKPLVIERGKIKVEEEDGIRVSEVYRTQNIQLRPIQKEVNKFNVLQKLDDFFDVRETEGRSCPTSSKIYSESFRFCSTSYTQPKKRLKIVSNPSSFNLGETRERVVENSKSDSDVSKVHNHALNSGLAKQSLVNWDKTTKIEENTFISGTEFWKWVKGNLNKGDYNSFVNGIKRYKNNKDKEELISDMKNLFAEQKNFSMCLSGLGLIFEDFSGTGAN